VKDLSYSEFITKLKANDPDLLARIKSKDEEALHALLKWLYVALTKYFYHNFRSTKFGYEDIEELASDVVLLIYDKLSLYDSRRSSSFEAWVYAIAKNRAIDRFRKNKAMHKAEHEPEDYYELNVRNLIEKRYPEFEAAILTGLETEDSEDVVPPKVSRLRRALVTLSEADQSVLLLKQVLEHEDIARIENITVDTLRKRYSRAIERLRTAYDKEGASERRLRRANENRSTAKKAKPRR
jgi:RNA polymerase sigma-70 factor (ECF subfamily)